MSSLKLLINFLQNPDFDTASTQFKQNLENHEQKSNQISSIQPLKATILAQVYSFKFSFFFGKEGGFDWWGKEDIPNQKMHTN